VITALSLILHLLGKGFLFLQFSNSFVNNWCEMTVLSDADGRYIFQLAYIYAPKEVQGLKGHDSISSNISLFW
jgi:hypothetical protein